MSDDKHHVGEPDRSRVAAGEDYEVQHVANETGLSPDEVRELIEEVGNDRNKLMAAALRKRNN